MIFCIKNKVNTQVQGLPKSEIEYLINCCHRIINPYKTVELQNDVKAFSKQGFVNLSSRR